MKLNIHNPNQMNHCRRVGREASTNYLGPTMLHILVFLGKCKHAAICVDKTRGVHYRQIIHRAQKGVHICFVPNFVHTKRMLPTAFLGEN